MIDWLLKYFYTRIETKKYIELTSEMYLPSTTSIQDALNKYLD